MKRPALVLLPLTALATAIVLLAGPGAEASPATYTVNSTADPGDGTCDATECTLREAIAAANTNAGTDTIEFSIPGAGPHTISPGSALPTITDPVTIDGTTEPDFAGTPVIELDGSGAGADVDGVTITAGSSTVKGLVINRFRWGIHLPGSGGGNRIEGNYIGTDVSGTVDLGNIYDGIATSFTSGNTIGGTAAGAGNVISGNDHSGIVFGTGATGNVVQGNLIGTDVSGTADLGNSWEGVRIYDQGNVIGGTAAGSANIISGNDGDGLAIIGDAATGNLVQGNFIGTDVTGTADLGNSSHGVSMDFGASGNTVGGTTLGARNVISANDQCGVWIFGSDTTENQVQGNYIGTEVNGTADLGNSSYGVYIYRAPGNTIGGTGAGEGNVIAHNGGNGVRVRAATATANAIRGNSIHSNGGKGIENTESGNAELAPPIVDSVGSVSGHTAPKCYPCTVEVFSDDEDEGRIYHGSTTSNDDATGSWTYPGAMTGPYITATITDTSGNTSEFSVPVAYSPPPVGGIAALPDVSDSSGWNYVAIAGLTAPALIILILSVSYARRRWVR